MRTFDIIPVIDLKGGRAVRATGGNRAEYRPLATPLCPDGDPLTAAKGLLEICAARTLYIADLDAIEGGASQHETILSIADALPGLTLWVDDGLVGGHSAQAWPLAQSVRPVVGSESLGAGRPCIEPHAILSLDFRGERFLGPPALLAEPGLWPLTLIVMCLHSVGASEGPDFARLGRIIGMAQNRRVFAAGGARDMADLEALASIGAAGVLISSALHGGAITRADIACLSA